MIYTVVISVPGSPTLLKTPVYGANYEEALRNGAAYAESIGGSVMSIY